MTDVFAAIDALNVELVKKYLKDGGDVSVKSYDGFGVFPYVVLQLLKKDADDYGYAPHQAASENDDIQLSNEKQKLFEIGTLLLEYGANYNDRLGKTNRSIKISDRVRSEFPPIHREWSSLHTRNKMLEQEEVGSALQTQHSKKPRKI